MQNSRRVSQGGLYFATALFSSSLAFSGATIFASPESSFAESVGPSVDVKTTIETVQSTMKAEKGKPEDQVDAKLKDIILPMFNFEEMAKRSLGAAWNKATPAEQKEFVDLFSDLLARTYLKKIKKNAEESVLLRISDSVDGNTAMVKSKMKSGEDEIEIDYRMSQDGGRWRVYDVVIENVGLVNNYRNEFPGIVRNEGFQGLIKRLKEKKAQNAESKK